ncbi:hypothetical protein ISCGN_012939 [Ixodes scapularis]
MNVRGSQELRSTLGRFELLLGVSVQDGDSPVSLVSARLAALAPHLDYLVLETHLQAPSNACRTAYSSVFYATSATPSVPIGQALAWMSELLLERGQQVVSCFSVTLGAVLFRGAHARHGPCESSELLSYMQVCRDGQWEPGAGSLDALAELRLGQGLVETHESQALLGTKASWPPMFYRTSWNNHRGYKRPTPVLCARDDICGAPRARKSPSAVSTGQWHHDAMPEASVGTEGAVPFHRRVLSVAASRSPSRFQPSVLDQSQLSSFLKHSENFRGASARRHPLCYQPAL